LAAFFLLRPNPPQQTSAQKQPPANNPAPGAAAPPGAAPTGASEGPLFRGTYRYQNTYQSGTAKVVTDCPACNATVTGETTAVYHWNGTGWTFAEGCRTETVTPTAVVNGIMQEASTQASGCGAASNTGTLTRVGD
jgi:hypothetical protein